MVISRIKNTSDHDQLNFSQKISAALINTSETAIHTAKAVVVDIVRIAPASISVLDSPKATYTIQGSKMGSPPLDR